MEVFHCISRICGLQAQTRCKIQGFGVRASECYLHVETTGDLKGGECESLESSGAEFGCPSFFIFFFTLFWFSSSLQAKASFEVEEEEDSF